MTNNFDLSSSPTPENFPHCMQAAFVASRLDELESACQKRWPKPTEQILEPILILVGTFAVSKAAQLLALNIISGTNSILFGLAIGAFWAGFTYHRATLGLAELRCKNSTQQALKSLDTAMKEDSNLTTHAYYQQNKDLLHKVEDLTPIFWGDLMVAIAASVIEILVSFWIALPSGLLLAIILSVFPVILIWMLSYIKSEHVNFAVWAQDKALIYQTYLPSPEA